MRANKNSTSNNTVEYTQPFNKRLMSIGLLAVVGICVALVIINQIGLSTTTYESAKQYNDFATVLVWTMGGITGMLFASRIARPRQTRPKSGIRTFLTIIGFILGFIPGLLLAMLISYPLSQHACRLSGSKYC